MFYIACVVYNKKIDNVRSLQHFLEFAEKHDDVRIVMLDNTTDSKLLEESSKSKYLKSVLYLKNNGNVGLAKAYNRILEITNSEDWIMWSDDDTWFSETFIQNVYFASRNNDNILITGMINTNKDTILSPIWRREKDNRHFEIGKTYKDLYCINSGLCTKRAVYNLIGKYDEGFFIDMIDYWLFDELHKRDIDQVYLVGGEIKQDFSGTSKGSISQKMKRFRIYAKDFNYYCDVEKKKWNYRVYILVKRLGKIFIEQIFKG